MTVELEDGRLAHGSGDHRRSRVTRYHLGTLDGYIRSANLLRDNSALFLKLDTPGDTADPSPGSAP